MTKKASAPLTAGKRHNFRPLPEQPELTPDRKKILVGAAKLVMSRLQQKGLLPAERKYADILANAAEMANFCNLVKNNRGLAADLLVDRKGKAVADDVTPLVCGPTAGQVERLFVYTSASKVFTHGIDPETNPRRYKKSMILLNELKPYLAFDWQLPLLEVMRDHMTADHLHALGDHLLLLDQPEQLQAVCALDPADLRKARGLSGDRFGEILEDYPMALRGLSLMQKQSVFDRMMSLAGNEAWALFSREPDYLVEIMGLSVERMEALGPSIVHLSLPALRQLEHLKPRDLKPFLEVFRRLLGNEAGALLIEPAFTPDILAPIVNAFREIGESGISANDPGAYEMAADLKWQAAQPKIAAWKQSHAGKKAIAHKAIQRKAAADKAQSEIDNLFP